MNSGKTNICLKTSMKVSPIKTNNGSILEKVSNFRYLGTGILMHSTENGVKQWKASACRAYSKLTKIRRSSLSRPPQLCFLLQQ